MSRPQTTTFSSFAQATTHECQPASGSLCLLFAVKQPFAAAILAELRRVLNGCGSGARIQYVDYVVGSGISLFDQICKRDLEGIVAKQKHAPYVSDREQSTWFKIRNRGYSQMAGRVELFEPSFMSKSKARKQGKFPR